jgi:hypothetical protein
MPKLTGTKIEKLEREFKKRLRMTPKDIQKLFPKSQAAAMVWHLQHKKGMTINKTIESNKITSYTYDPDTPGVVINGSKRLWDMEHGQKNTDTT